MTEVVVMNLWLYKITNLLTGKVLGTRFTIRPPSCIITSTNLNRGRAQTDDEYQVTTLLIYLYLHHVT